MSETLYQNLLFFLYVLERQKASGALPIDVSKMYLRWFRSREHGHVVRDSRVPCRLPDRSAVEDGIWQVVLKSIQK